MPPAPSRATIRQRPTIRGCSGLRASNDPTLCPLSPRHERAAVEVIAPFRPSPSGPNDRQTAANYTNRSARASKSSAERSCSPPVSRPPSSPRTSRGRSTRTGSAPAPPARGRNGRRCRRSRNRPGSARSRVTLRVNGVHHDLDLDHRVTQLSAPHGSWRAAASRRRRPRRRSAARTPITGRRMTASRRGHRGNTRAAPPRPAGGNQPPMGRKIPPGMTTGRSIALKRYSMLTSSIRNGIRFAASSIAMKLMFTFCGDEL